MSEGKPDLAQGLLAQASLTPEQRMAVSSEQSRLALRGEPSTVSDAVNSLARMSALQVKGVVKL